MKVVYRFPDGESAETDAYDQLNLLAHAQLVERSVQSRCGGHCECGTCRVVIESGRVSPMGERERELLAYAGVVDPRVRLACQTFPEKDVGGPENTILLTVPAEKFVDARGKRRR